MKFEILGNLRIWNGDQHLEPSAKKVGVLLAALVLRANKVVSIDCLLMEIWGERPPKRATASLHVYVSQLRKLIPYDEAVGHPVVTRSPGYLLRVNDEDLDLNVFRGVVDRGRQDMRAGRYEQALTAFEQALQLLRGNELAWLSDGPIVSGFMTWLAEIRLEIQEMIMESHLMLGRHRELVAKLYSLVSENPFHEAFYRQLMLALYRCDRRADALHAYQSARSLLQAELGLEPCASLRDLQGAILRDDLAGMELSLAG